MKFKVCIVVPMTEIANEYLLSAPDFGGSNTTMENKENSKLLNEPDEVREVKQQDQFEQVEEF